MRTQRWLRAGRDQPPDALAGGAQPPVAAARALQAHVPPGQPARAFQQAHCSRHLRPRVTRQWGCRTCLRLSAAGRVRRRAPAGHPASTPPARHAAARGAPPGRCGASRRARAAPPPRACPAAPGPRRAPPAAPVRAAAVSRLPLSAATAHRATLAPSSPAAPGHPGITSRATARPAATTPGATPYAGHESALTCARATGPMRCSVTHGARPTCVSCQRTRAPARPPTHACL